MEISKILTPLMAAALVLASCKTVQTTKAPLKKASGAVASKATPSGVPAGPVAADVKSNALNDEDFVLARTLDGMVVSPGGIPVMDYATGALLIPTCPTSTPTCAVPLIYAFSPTLMDWSHKIMPSSAILGQTISYDGILIGSTSSNSSGKVARFELSAVDYLTLPDPQADADGNPIPLATPIAVVANVLQGIEHSPVDRPIVCNPYAPLCLAAATSACGSASPSLKAFEFDTGFTNLCVSYPATQRAIGFTINNELALTDISGGQSNLLFRDMADASAAPVALELPGSGVSGDPYSFLDYSKGLAFAFTTSNGANSWSVVQLDTKKIIANIPLKFAMTGRGQYFIDGNGTIMEFRPANGDKPAAIYTVEAGKVFTILGDTSTGPQ
jgi:hypothetical protein